MSKKWSLLLCIAGISAVLCACGQNGNGNGNGSPSPIQTQSESPAASPAASGAASPSASASPSPVAEPTTKTIKDAKGEVEVPVKPVRIVDVSGSTEELLIVGSAPVGTANQDSDVPGVVPRYAQDQLAGATVVGNYAKGVADLELIASLEPDLIVSSLMFDKVYDQLRKIAPVFVIDENPQTFAGWRDRLVQIGALLGEEAQAAAWQAAYDAKANALAERIRAETGEGSFAVFVAFPNNYSLFSNTGVGDMLFNDLKLPRSEGTPLEGWGATIGMEGLSELKADHILLHYAEGMDEELNKSAVWNGLEAVKQGRVYPLPNKDYYGMSFTPLGKDLLLDKLAELILPAQ